MVMKQLTVMFNGKVQRTYLLDISRVVIGRGSAVHIALEDNPFVSRQHAAISFEGATHVLQDLGGPNGTFISEKRVRVHPLAVGDRILLGKHSIRYEDARPGAESLKALAKAPAEPASAEPEAMTFEDAGDEGPWQRAVPEAGGRPAPPQPSSPTKNFPLDPDAFGLGAETTVAASKEELDEMVRRMALKGEPHLWVPRESGVDLVPVDSAPFDVGWSASCHFRLDGGKWVGKKAARLEKQHGSWYLISLSPMWSPVEVGGTRIKKKIKLRPGATITIRGQRFRFNPGEGA
jgi:pSer/pThr/pTyr-binding forkhead associated (FHA) protein